VHRHCGEFVQEKINFGFGRVSNGGGQLGSDLEKVA